MRAEGQFGSTATPPCLPRLASRGSTGSPDLERSSEPLSCQSISHHTSEGFPFTSVMFSRPGCTSRSASPLSEPNVAEQRESTGSSQLTALMGFGLFLPSTSINIMRTLFSIFKHYIPPCELLPAFGPPASVAPLLLWLDVHPIWQGEKGTRCGPTVQLTCGPHHRIFHPSENIMDDAG